MLRMNNVIPIPYAALDDVYLPCQPLLICFLFPIMIWFTFIIRIYIIRIFILGLKYGNIEISHLATNPCIYFGIYNVGMWGKPTNQPPQVEMKNDVSWSIALNWKKCGMCMFWFVEKLILSFIFPMMHRGNIFRIQRYSMCSMKKSLTLVLRWIEILLKITGPGATECETSCGSSCPYSAVSVGAPSSFVYKSYKREIENYRKFQVNGRQSVRISTFRFRFSLYIFCCRFSE